MQVRIALDKHKTLSDLKQYCFNVLRVLCIQAISLSEGPFSFCMHLSAARVESRGKLMLGDGAAEAGWMGCEGE